MSNISIMATDQISRLYRYFRENGTLLPVALMLCSAAWYCLSPWRLDALGLSLAALAAVAVTGCIADIAGAFKKKDIDKLNYYLIYGCVIPVALSINVLLLYLTS